MNKFNHASALVEIEEPLDEDSTNTSSAPNRNDVNRAAGAGGLHVAIIMDGNGRWAIARGLPRLAGHRAGAQAVRRITRAAAQMGVRVLTLYAFSSDNWQRPSVEVAGLMRLLKTYIQTETKTCIENGVRLSVTGRRDRLAGELVGAIERAEQATRHGATLHLRIAVDYSGRDAIVRAAARLVDEQVRLSRKQFMPRGLARVAFGQSDGTHATVTRGDIARLLAEPGEASAPDVDLLIRTGGERRLSDFLLWKSAYAELVFTTRMFPDFDTADLAAALDDFKRRDRRFGRLGEVNTSASKEQTMMTR